MGRMLTKSMKVSQALIHKIKKAPQKRVLWGLFLISDPIVSLPLKGLLSWAEVQPEFGELLDIAVIKPIRHGQSLLQIGCGV